MKTFTPEISWHNRLPALSVDILQHEGVYKIATGGNDGRVYIWSVVTSDKAAPDIRIRAGLRRHQKSVGAVRFSSQQMLASGDDDGYIYLWKHKSEELIESTNAFLNDDGFEDLETWQQYRVLRGHIEDICDLSWSKDGQYLLSGSVDNSAILWDTVKGAKLWCSDLIKGYVQGVAIDPHTQFMAAISSDRTLRVYNFNDKRLVNATRCMNIKGKYKAFFCDDTVQTFCRRFEFSPDGQFLLAPTSRLIEKEQKQQPPPPPPPTPPAKSEEIEVITLEDSLPPAPEGDKVQSRQEEKKEEGNENENEKEDEKDDDEMVEEIEIDKEDEIEKEIEKEERKAKEKEVPKKSKKTVNVFLVFKRSSFNKPTHYYPTGKEVALCARFSPVLYKLRDTESNFWGIPYRIVFAVATSRSVLLYDSQQPTPIGYASQIHLARLTDIAWSNDGRLLMVSSYDGYSTLITFDQGEFGEIYSGPMIEPVLKPAADEEKVEEGTKGQKRSKAPKENSASKKEKLENNGEEAPDEDTEQAKIHEIKASKKATPKKIVPTRLPEAATMWRFLKKRTKE